MSLLKHKLLKRLANDLERGMSPLRWIDLYAAQHIADIEQSAKNESKEHLAENDVVALTVLVSYVSEKGETFLNLRDLPNDVLSGYQLENFHVDNKQLEGKSLEERLHALSSSPAVRTIYDDTEPTFPLEALGSAWGLTTDTAACLTIDKDKISKPLVLWQHRLYLARYWRLHQIFESWLHAQSLMKQTVDQHHFPLLKQQLQKVFSLEDSEVFFNDVNWQAVSAGHTLLQNFTLITGGPGTGKTTTAASLLYLLMFQHQLTDYEAVPPMSIRLLAPTGKAAVKLADSIRHHLCDLESRLLGVDKKALRLSDCLPDTGETIHRFLYQQGALRENLNQHRHFNSADVLIGKQQSRKARVDVILIDEASMIDLALMVELIQVIPETTQVILLGDHFQLPAVEPGQVFAECVQRYETRPYSTDFAQNLSRLSGYSLSSFFANHSAPQEIENSSYFNPLCELRKTYRFSGELKRAAEQIKAGQSKSFKKQFGVLSADKDESEQNRKSVQWHVLNDQTNHTQEMIAEYRPYFELVQKGASLLALDAEFERFQLLCSTHEGPLGVVRMNELIEAKFVVSQTKHLRSNSDLYHGKAILVTRNHPHLGVFNGDVGFAISTPNRGSDMEIHFPVKNQAPIVIAPGQIREWQPAYAMTVHKSQGSEYEHVGIVLADYAKELLTRALLYTGVTRSKKCCDIWAGSAALEKAFEQK